MNKILGFWSAALALCIGFSLLGLSSCNVTESQDTYILRMKLDDSLAVDSSLFKTIDIDLFDSSGNMTHADVFKGPYHKADSAKLANMIVNSPIPNPVTIRVTAYKDTGDYWVFKVKVANGIREPLTPVHYGSSNPNVPNPQDTLAPTVLPKSVVIITTSPLLLTVNGPSLALKASVLPVEAKQEIKWTLPSNTVAMLEPGNLIKGLAPGIVTLTASSAAVSTVFDTLVVMVQDPPAVLPTQINLKSPSLTLQVGAAPVTLEATVSPSEASQNLIWTFDAPGVVEIVNNNQIKGLKAGTAKVTATSAVKSSVTAILNVTVETPVIVPDSLFLRLATPMVLAVGGADVELAWTVLPAGADQGVEWTSSDTTIAQIVGGSKVRPLKKGPAKITGKSKVKSAITTTFDVNVIVPVKVDAINILPKTLTLYTGGPEGKLNVTLTGNDSGAKFNLASSNDLIASVSAAGSVKGLAAGSTVITAAVVGYPAVTSMCSVKVVKDPPVVTVSPNQSVAFNGEAVFTVSVAPQAYGTTVEIKADMDGDNVYEQTVLNKDTAEFKQKYTEVKTTTVSFKVKDTEGNEETVTRRVTVGAPGTPVVSIINPSKDTAINVLSFKIRFTIKDTALKIDTFVDSTVALIAGSNKVRAARRNAGGEGSDEVTILVDNTAPAVTIAGAANQTSGVAAFSLAGTASDLSSGLQSVNITGALSGNGLATLTADTWSKGGLTLAEGPNTLVATALDKAGNTQTASIMVTLDSRKPGVPVVTAPVAVRAGPIKWTWVRANGDGSGRFKVKINGGPEIDATLAEYSLATGLVEGTVYGLSVKETDPIAGDGPWSDEKKVLYDPKRPDPGISVALSSTNDPTWTWSSNGGVGIYRWYYKTTPITFIGNNNPATTYTPTLAAGTDATYNLCVQEKDSPEWGDEWGVEKCASIRVDKKGPDITDISHPDGYVTNQTSLTFSFTAEGPKTYTCQLGTEGENNCILSASDALGNTSTVTRKIWRRSNVVFVRVGGTGNGSSFDNAYGSLRQALSQLGPGQNQVWVMEGTYPMTGTPGPYIPSGVSIYGGFSADRNQGSVTDRRSSTNRTILTSRWEVGDDFSREIFNIRNEDDSPIQNILLDGMTLSAGYYGIGILNGTAITLSNMRFSNSTAAPIIAITNSTVTLNDCEFSNNGGEIMSVFGNTVTLNRCKFFDNQGAVAGFYLAQGKAIVNNSVFQNSGGFSGFEYWITVDAETSTPILEMYNNTIQGYGTDPGPIVTTRGEKFSFLGSGNHP